MRPFPKLTYNGLLPRVSHWLAAHWCRLLIGLAATSTGNAVAQTTTWTNPVVGNWFVEGNWNLGVPQSASVPRIDNGGLAIVNTPGAVGAFVQLGSSFGSGYLDVTGAGRLDLGSRILVESGLLTVTRSGGVGGLVIVSDSSPIGGGTSIGGLGYGEVRVSGAGSYLDAKEISLGDSSNEDGEGRLEILGGGRVDSTGANMGLATVNISGANSTWVSTNYFQVGRANRHTQISITQGGTLYTTNPTLQRGSVRVGGVGSSWSSNNVLVGFAGGSSSVNVDAGGLLTSNGATLGQSLIGSPASTGIVTVTGSGSTWNNAAHLAIGGPSSGSYANSRGEMYVTDGGVVNSSTAELGAIANNFGFARITGNAARWSNSGELVVARYGAGALEVINGGTLQTNRGFVGDQLGSVGSALVANGGSWTATGSLFIGNAGGSGNLQVLSGGLASTAGNSYLGFSAGAFGAATVSGSSSTWNTAGTLIVGGNFLAPGGTGRLAIADGGVVNAGSVILYDTGEIVLSNDAKLTGPLTSYGGAIQIAAGEPKLASNVVLQGDGLAVHTFGNSAEFSGSFSGVGGLTKTGPGAGVLTLSGSSDYAGATMIDSGTLLVDGSITGPTTVNSGAALGGTGVVGAVLIKEGGRLAPGANPGLLTTGDMKLEGGGSYLLNLRSDGTGAPGVEWNSVAVQTLDTSALSEENPFVLQLQSFNRANEPGYLDVWDRGISHTWDDVLSAVALDGGDFDPRHFQVDTTGFQSPISGDFRIVQDGTSLDLQYDAAVVSDSILVSNLAAPRRGATPIGNNPNPVDPPQGSGTPWYWGAQSFQSDAKQYILTSIDAVVGDGSTDPPPQIVAQLFSDSSGSIGELIATFVAPEVTGTPNALTFVPNTPITLAAETAYWFVLGVENPGDGTFSWQYAEGDDFVGPGLLGRFADSVDSGDAWSYGDGNPYALQVNVTSPLQLPGDFNGDGAVDSADYTLWRDNLGSPDSLLNDDTPGVGQDDYDLWKVNYGTMAHAAINAETTGRAVPEPQTVILLFVAFGALVRSGGRRVAGN